MNRFESFPFSKDKPVYKQMEEFAHPSTYNREEMRMYERSLDRYRIYRLTMKTEFDEGYDEGLEDGRKIGSRLASEYVEKGFPQRVTSDFQHTKEQKIICVAQRLEKKGLPKSAIDDILCLINNKREGKK